jgi:cytochrome c551/c552
MLPVIQENILLLKGFQVATQILLCLLLCHLMGEAFFRLPMAFRARQLSPRTAPAQTIGQGPRILSGWRTGLFLALGLASNLLALKIAYRTTLLPGPFWGALMFAFVLGLILLLWARRYTFQQNFITGFIYLLGLEGEALLFGVAFLLLSAESLLLQPEMWPFLNHRPTLFLSWHGLARFAEYVLLAVLLATAGRMYIGNETASRRAPLPAILAALLLPLCLLFELAVLPDLARTRTYFVLCGLILVVATITTLLLAVSHFNPHKQTSKPLLGAVILLIGLWAFCGFTAREQVLSPVVLAGLGGLGEPAEVAVLEKPLAPSQPETRPEAASTAEKEGEKVFNSICVACHRFDQRLVGPPLDTVLPKYRGKPAKLQAFLHNPVKVNPDYPSMPNLHLTDRQVETVAQFLLSRAGKTPSPETP